MHRITSFFCALSVAFSAENAPKPNFIVILADDLGYSDLACSGAEDIATPHIDRMAREGAKFTSCYVAPVCSPTRASLMTGSIAQRVGIGGVLFPRNDHGLNPDEITLPELLKEQGYATAITGMDLLPTLVKLAGGDVPKDRVLDGKDIRPLLAGEPGAKSPHEAIYHLRGRNVQGIRVGDWKYLAVETP